MEEPGPCPPDFPFISTRARKARPTRKTVYKAAKNLIALACDAAGIDRRPFWPEQSVAPSALPTVNAEVPTDNHAAPAPEATEPAPAEEPEGARQPAEK